MHSGWFREGVYKSYLLLKQLRERQNVLVLRHSGRKGVRSSINHPHSSQKGGGTKKKEVILRSPPTLRSKKRDSSFHNSMWPCVQYICGSRNALDDDEEEDQDMANGSEVTGLDWKVFWKEASFCRIASIL